jgi:hypothetical protein
MPSSHRARLPTVIVLLSALTLVLLSACKKDNSTVGAPAREAMTLYARGFNALLADPKAMLTEYFEKIPQSGPDASLRSPRRATSSRRARSTRRAAHSPPPGARRLPPWRRYRRPRTARSPRSTR